MCTQVGRRHGKREPHAAPPPAHLQMAPRRRDANVPTTQKDKDRYRHLPGWGSITGHVALLLEPNRRPRNHVRGRRLGTQITPRARGAEANTPLSWS